MWALDSVISAPCSIGRVTLCILVTSLHGGLQYVKEGEHVQIVTCYCTCHLLHSNQFVPKLLADVPVSIFEFMCTDKSAHVFLRIETELRAVTTSVAEPNNVWP